MSLLNKYNTQGSILSNPTPVPFDPTGKLNPSSLLGSQLDLANQPAVYDTQGKLINIGLAGSNLDLQTPPTPYLSNLPE